MGKTLLNLSSQQDSQAHKKSALCIFIARLLISSHLRWQWRSPATFQLVHSYLDLYWSVYKLGYLVPLSDNSSETVARKLMDSWISRIGVHSTITADRESQFTSSLFRKLSHLLGSSHFRTTACHPSEDGLNERFHWQLKSAVIAISSRSDWLERLSIILLEIKTLFKKTSYAVFRNSSSVQLYDTFSKWFWNPRRTTILFPSRKLPD